MSDIVERLKEACVIDRHYGKSVTLTLDYDDYMEAADLITALRAENERLRQVLENTQHARVLQGKAITDASKEITRLRAELQTARAKALEEAARVAERTTTYEDIADRSPEEWFRMGRIIASVIRALKE